MTQFYYPINKINSFPIINSLDLIQTDENWMSSFMPVLNEQFYDMRGAGKTFISYGNETERLNYFPTSVEGGNCDFFPAPQLCRVDANTGNSFLSWFYGDMKSYNGYPAGYGGFSEPLISSTPGSALLKPYFSYNESFNKVKAISNGSEINTEFKVIGIGHNLNQLPIGRTMTGDLIAPDSCVILSSTTSEILHTGGTNLNSNAGPIPFFADPKNGIAIGVIENINCEISYTDWDEWWGGYLIHKVPVTFTIFYKTELFLTIPKHSVVNKFLDYDLNVNTYVFGNGTGNFNTLNQVIKKDGDRFEIATSFGEQFPSVYYAGEKNLLVEKLYFWSPEPNEAFNTIVADKFNIYPFSNGAKVNNSTLVINRRSLEAIDPTNTQGDGLDEFEFDLEIDNTNVDSIFCCSDMAYTVLGGVKSQGKDLIIFALRDGAGFYTCDISEFIPVGNEIINFTYENGIIYIGHVDDTGLINYKLLIPDLPLARFEKVTYEFKKLGISFIPCQTHCMAKGGIVSKIY